MKCALCKRALRDGDGVVPILRYVTNEKRGDFVTSKPSACIHAHHIKEEQ